MKIAKRFLAFLLVVLCAVSMFACAGGGETSDAPSQESVEASDIAVLENSTESVGETSVEPAESEGESSEAPAPESSEPAEESKDETSKVPSGSGSGSGSGGPSKETHVYEPATPDGVVAWIYKRYKPDFSIIEGIFDGNTSSYKKDVTNILLLGCDSARSDAIILMSINNTKKRVVFTSILRDSYVPIPGKGSNKINSAHASGGADLLIKTVEKNFGVEIDNYIRLNFDSYYAAIEAMGGIDVTVNADNYNWFSKYKKSSLEGLTKAQCIDGTRVVHIDGHEALAYARNRYYSNGDITRTLHQRDLVIQVVKSFRNKSLTELHSVLKTVMPYIQTDMTKEQMIAHVWNALDYFNYDIVSHRIPDGKIGFKFETINKASVITYSIEKNATKLNSVIYD